MGLIAALGNSVAGILVVFVVLILLMYVIKLLLKLTDENAKKPAEVAPAAPAAPAVAAQRPLAPGTAGDIKLYDTDPRDAAMIMAIVADQLQKPLNELRFISIREVK